MTALDQVRYGADPSRKWRFTSSLMKGEVMPHRVPIQRLCAPENLQKPSAQSVQSLAFSGERVK